MEKLLIKFIDTLDASLKKLQKQIGEDSEISKLTINQYHYIEAVHELGKPAITQIADRLNITKASVTAGINKLAILGFVSKTRSNKDRRVWQVSLTELGDQLVIAKYRALEEYGAFISTALSDDEVIQFKKILTKLVKLFEPV